jgi:hypothetical protein
MFCGNRKEVPKDDRMTTGVGLSTSKPSDACPPGTAGWACDKAASTR